MKSYLDRFNELNDDLLSAIKAMMRNNNLDELSLSDVSQRVSVVWQSDKDNLYEGELILLKLKKERFSIIVDHDGYPGEIEIVEDDSDVKNPLTLIEIRDCLIGALMDIHPRICYHCGKPMSAGYCISNGEEYYCSKDCLHEHYNPEEWIEIYDDGNSDSYWTEWEEESDEE